MVNLLEMIDLLYPYDDENRIKIDDNFKRIYYAYTISHRPLAFHLEELFPLKIEGTIIVIKKKDNIEFCKKFENLVKKDVNILSKIMLERDIHRNNLKKAINSERTDEVIKELFLLGRYGIEWYYPYKYLYERLKRYFSSNEINEITDKLKVSDEIPYYLEIYLGFKKLQNKEISLNEFIEKYGVLERSSLKPSKYEDLNYLKEIIDNYNYNESDDLLMNIRKRIKIKRETLNRIKKIVDKETFLLLEVFSEIDSENEILHKERAKALRYLYIRGINYSYINEYCKRYLDFQI
ncbi:MAG: hypothetical protein QXY70_03470 [Nanopusillaceae archaeon]